MHPSLWSQPYFLFERIKSHGEMALDEPFSLKQRKRAYSIRTRLSLGFMASVLAPGVIGL